MWVSGDFGHSHSPPSEFALSNFPQTQTHCSQSVPYSFLLLLFSSMSVFPSSADLHACCSACFCSVSSCSSNFVVFGRLATSCPHSCWISCFTGSGHSSAHTHPTNKTEVLEKKSGRFKTMMTTQKKKASDTPTQKPTHTCAHNLPHTYLVWRDGGFPLLPWRKSGSLLSVVCIHCKGTRAHLRKKESQMLGAHSIHHLLCRVMNYCICNVLELSVFSLLSFVTFQHSDRNFPQNNSEGINVTLVSVWHGVENLRRDVVVCSTNLKKRCPVRQKKNRDFPHVHTWHAHCAHNCRFALPLSLCSFGLVSKILRDQNHKVSFPRFLWAAHGKKMGMSECVREDREKWARTKRKKEEKTQKKHGTLNETDKQTKTYKQIERFHISVKDWRSECVQCVQSLSHITEDL